MKKFFALLLLVVLLTPAYSQVSLDIDMEDSARLADGYIPLEFEQLLIDEWYCPNTPVVINNDSLLSVFEKTCSKLPDTIDFSKNILLHEYFGGDCHVWFIQRMYLDTATKKMIWKVYNIWGGCRAGGGKHFFIKAPKPPDGYQVVIDEVLVDRLYHKGTTGDY